jgi:hypothetical protein
MNTPTATFAPPSATAMAKSPAPVALVVSTRAPQTTAPTGIDHSRPTTKPMRSIVGIMDSYSATHQKRVASYAPGPPSRTGSVLSWFTNPETTYSGRPASSIAG